MEHPEEKDKVLSLEEHKEGKKKRGRKKGQRAGLTFFRSPKRWEPVEWRPEYTEMVTMSVCGFSNIAIAEKFGYTTVHISNILNTNEAKSLKQIVNEKWRENLLTKVPDRLTRIEDIALQNVTTVLADKTILEKSPMAVLRASMDVLKGLGRLKGDGVQVQVNTNVANQTPIPESLMPNILESLEASRRVDERYKNTKLLNESTGS